DAEVLLPDELAVHVVAEDAWGAEGGEDVLAVGGAGRRGVAVPVVRRLPGHVLRRGLLPQHLAVAAAPAEDVTPPAAVVGAGQEDAVAPDDRRRVADAGQLRLPQDVLLLAPLQHDLLALDVALFGGAAPVRPQGLLVWLLVAEGR